MADIRTYTGGRFALDIDGYNVGFLKDFDGLSMEADVATHQLGPDNVQKKGVTMIKWGDGTATVGMGMGKGMYEWIQAAFHKGFVTKNGAFTAGDFNYKAQRRVDFFNALITEVTVPKLSGDSKESAYFTVKFSPEYVRWSKGDGSDIRAVTGAKQKAWQCSNFLVEIGGLPCARVASVDSFTWKCGVAKDEIGGVRESTKHPTKVEVPNIKLAISSADQDAWTAAAKKWFVDGCHEEADEMTGRIVFLGPDMKKPLGEITLLNVGFAKFNFDKAEANSEKISRFNVELYVEKMEFKLDYVDA